MYLKLIRNQAKGSAITSRLVIDGRWFCNTLERVGYQIPALCYHVAVTQSPKFKRPLPIVQNVPQRSGIRFHRGTKPEHSTGCILVLADNINDNTDNLRPNQHPLGAQGEYSSPRQEVDCRGTLSKLSSNNNSSLSSNKKNIGSRSAADVENQLTQLLLQTQQAHEEIILEVINFTPGTQYGYDHPCPPELQKP